MDLLEFRQFWLLGYTYIRGVWYPFRVWYYSKIEFTWVAVIRWSSWHDRLRVLFISLLISFGLICCLLRVFISWSLDVSFDMADLVTDWQRISLVSVLSLTWWLLILMVKLLNCFRKLVSNITLNGGSYSLITCRCLCYTVVTY